MTQAALDFTARQDRKDRDRGMARATAHANADHKAWAEVAYAFLVRYARTHATFAVWQLADAGRLSGDVPTLPGLSVTDKSRDKAWGSIVLRAMRAGVIAKAGFVVHPTRHQSPTVQWRSLICEREAA